MDLHTSIEAAARDSAYGRGQPPTADQAKAGNYRLGRVKWNGLPLAIENPRGSVREGVDPDGTAWRNMMQAHYGYIEGTKGADGDGVDVFVGPVPESGTVYVINQIEPDTGDFDEHKAMLGFPDQGSAEQAYRGSYDAGWQGLGSMVECSLDQFRRWLKRGKLTAPLSASDLSTDGSVLMDNVQWKDDVPADTSLADLMYWLRQNDPDGLLMDPMMQDDPASEAEAEVALDALVVPYGQLQRKMQQLYRVLQQASTGPKPVSLTIAKPFRLRGVINVSVIFELSDGQTITIWFHSAGASSSRVQQQDELVSWRWALNKKDITILVARETGQELNPRIIARRVMALAARNSDKFAKANADRAERLNSIDMLTRSAEEKRASLTELTSKIDELKQEVQKRQEHAESRAAASSAGPAHSIQPHTEVTGVVPNGHPTAAAPVATLPPAEVAVLHELGAPASDIAIVANYGSYAACASDERNQDMCDHLMQSRIIEVRNGLRRLGWTGDTYGKLKKDGDDGDSYTMTIDTSISASKYNVTNCNFQVNVTRGGEDYSKVSGKVPNDMSKSASEIAQQVNALTDGPVVQGQQQEMPTQKFASTAGVGDIMAVQTRYHEGEFGVSWASTNIATADSMEAAAAIAKAVAESGADNITDMREAAKRFIDGSSEPAANAETNAKDIANAIAALLGGNKFMAMTGAKQLVFLPEGGVQFSLPPARNKINLVSITQEGDAYNMQFYYKRGVTMKLVSEENGVSGAQLAKVFSEQTGLVVSLDSGMGSREIEGATEAIKVALKSMMWDIEGDSIRADIPDADGNFHPVAAKIEPNGSSITVKLYTPDGKQVSSMDMGTNEPGSSFAKRVNDLATDMANNGTLPVMAADAEQPDAGQAATDEQPAHIDGPKVNVVGENTDPNAPADGQPPESAQLAEQQAVADADPVQESNPTTPDEPVPGAGDVLNADQQQADADPLAIEAHAISAEATQLTGSDKQVDWANKIRHDVLADLDKNADQMPYLKDLIGELKTEIGKVNSAKWWIDNKDGIYLPTMDENGNVALNAGALGSVSSLFLSKRAGTPDRLGLTDLASRLKAAQRAESDRRYDEMERLQSQADTDPVQQDQQAAAGDEARDAALAYLKNVIDGTEIDLMDLEVPERLGAIHEAYQGDADMMALFNQAANAYSSHMVNSAKAILA